MSDSNSSDLYSTTARFSKAVAATASTLMTPPKHGDHDLLLSNSSYKQAMKDALNSQTSSQVTKRRTDFSNSNLRDLYGSKYATSEQYFKSSFANSKTAFKILTHIPDELLDEIPIDNKKIDDGKTFSLFQGFNAALPAIDEEIELNKSLGSNNDGLLKTLTNQEINNNDSDFSFKLPNGLTKEKISDSYSTSNLTHFKQNINNNLDLLEIRKNLAANEILEIDNKISKLNELRKLVFKRVARLEQNELFLESHLDDINDRIQMIKDYNMEEIEKDINGKQTNDEIVTEEEVTEKEIEENNETPLLSKSIYNKLQENPPKFRKKSHKSRKTTPTLQQYYEPGSEIKSFQAHEDSITCFDFDIPFGTMVSASLDNTVRIWDLSRARCTGLLEGHNAPVKCIQMEDSIVITGSLDASLKLWDLTKLGNGDDDHNNNDNDQFIHTFESHIDEITALSFHNYNLVSGSQDRTIRQWDLQSGYCLQTIDVLWASQLNQSTNLDSTQYNYIDKSTPFIGALQTYDAALATGTSDGIVRLWDLRSGDVVRTLVGHTGPVTSLQFDDKFLTTGSLDRSIRIWDLRTGGINDAFAYESPISSLQFDSRRIVSSNNENTIKIYDRLDGKHTSCGGINDDSIINYVRYREGYLVEGRTNGKIGIWAI
ncbi:hypothetical protein WICMUC_004618 [Wickerhamomyces mucosus]|uniref:Mitochondrial fission protein n=1 Tax=Wickerhamomyces mucosus TaxID=1378264 RepID=A0A9P8PFR6_9ASCO|nr:hypothetical protein WICMUC_004618 [Wickerhamomyces mucosus]